MMKDVAMAYFTCEDSGKVRRIWVRPIAAQAGIRMRYLTTATQIQVCHCFGWEEEERTRRNWKMRRQRRWVITVTAMFSDYMLHVMTKKWGEEIKCI